MCHSNIYFDYEECFCGRPYIGLHANKEFPSTGHDRYTIVIGVYDDYDVGLIYKTDENNFTPILHELINWMYDHNKRSKEAHAYRRWGEL